MWIDISPTERVCLNAHSAEKLTKPINVNLSGEVIGQTTVTPTDYENSNSIDLNVDDIVVQHRIGYGTCDTAAGTAMKIVQINDPMWVQEPGSIIGVKFSVSNTASNCTIACITSDLDQYTDTQLAAIAKPIWYDSAVYTSDSTSVTGKANRIIFYMFDGTHWVFININGLDGNTVPSAYCSTTASTAAKTATCTGFVLKANRYIQVVMTKSNTKAGPITLNINSTGAKSIWINGAASSSSNYTLPASSYIAYYDGTYYHFRTDGVLPGNIAGAISDITLSEDKT
jgi:hypothetical protein